MGQTSDRGDVEAEEDPLVELARIVSEDGGFSGPKPEKPKMTRNEQNERDALADGLEAELLQELETSFAVRETLAPVSSRAPATRESSTPAGARASTAPVRAQPAEEESDPDELLRSIEEQLSQFERRQAGRFATTSSSFSADATDSEATDDSAFPAEEPKEPIFGAPHTATEPQEEWQGRRTSRIRPFAESLEALDAISEPGPEESLARPAAPRPEYRFRGPASADWDRASASREETELSRDEYRPREEPARFQDDRPETDLFTQAGPTFATTSARDQVDDDAGRRGRAAAEGSTDALRRERQTAAFPEFDEQVPAERLSPDLTGIEAGLSRELEPRYSDPSNGDKWQDGDAPADEPRVAAAIAPGPSRRAAAARAAAAQRGRSRFGLLTAAVVILVVLIGAGGAFYLRSSEQASSGPPPVIAADEGAVRIEASQEQPAAEGETVGEAVYNRVAGAAPQTEEQVVEGAEEPREIARIVLPPSQTDADEALVRPVGGENGAATAAADAIQEPAATSTEGEIGPRRVPTFVVRADGTIVTTSEAGVAAPDPATAQAQQLATETEPIEPVPVPTVAIAEAGAPAESASTESPPIPTPPAAAEDMVPRPTIDEPPAEVAAVEPIEPATPPPSAAASTDTSAPADVLANAPAESPPPAAAGAGEGFVVQLSAQRSMEQAQAAYASAQQQFSSVLGNLDPQIQEANLGEKGIYFRVRVGPWATRDEAIGVCESLKAAGGSCFVTQ